MLLFRVMHEQSGVPIKRTDGRQHLIVQAPIINPLSSARSYFQGLTGPRAVRLRERSQANPSRTKTRTVGSSRGSISSFPNSILYIPHHRITLQTLLFHLFLRTESISESKETEVAPYDEAESRAPTKLEKPLERPEPMFDDPEDALSWEEKFGNFNLSQFGESERHMCSLKQNFEKQRRERPLMSLPEQCLKEDKIRLQRVATCLKQLLE